MILEGALSLDRFKSLNPHSFVEMLLKHSELGAMSRRELESFLRKQGDQVTINQFEGKNCRQIYRYAADFGHKEQTKMRVLFALSAITFGAGAVLSFAGFPLVATLTMAVAANFFFSGRDTGQNLFKCKSFLKSVHSTLLWGFHGKIRDRLAQREDSRSASPALIREHNEYFEISRGRSLREDFYVDAFFTQKNLNELRQTIGIIRQRSHDGP